MPGAIHRDIDVLVHGATGFLGRRAAARLAQVVAPGHRVGLAGRSEERLKQLAAELAPRDFEIVVGNALDVDAMRSAASRSCIVVNTAGPFAKYGDAIVAACAEYGTHYVDITGETAWAARLIERHHDTARADGTFIVPFCGFDSVPADLGCWMLAREVARSGESLEDVLCVYRLRGGLNGGTWATALELAEHEDRRVLANPFSMVPGFEATPQELAYQADPRAAVREPTTDRWCPVFFMAAINRRVVMRSAMLSRASSNRDRVDFPGDSYGPRFRYVEHMSMGRGTRLSAATTRAASRASELLLATRFGRAIGRRLGPKPGEGPSDSTIENGFSRLDFYARTSAGRELHLRLEIDGDPGNRVTVLCLTEAAQCLLREGDALRLGQPGSGGVLTPSLAFGERLLARLEATGEWRADSVAE